MAGVRIPTGYALTVTLSEKGRRLTRLRETEPVDWSQVMAGVGSGWLQPYAEALVRYLRASAGGSGKTSWPRSTGRSAGSFRAVTTDRVTAADRFYNRQAGTTRGAGLVVNTAPYAKAVERGAYSLYRRGGTDWEIRRPKGWFVKRLEGRIRWSALRGRNVSELLDRAVTAAWRKQVREAKRNG